MPAAASWVTLGETHHALPDLLPGALMDKLYLLYGPELAPSTAALLTSLPVLLL
jgi:hypothetical protein